MMSYRNKASARAPNLSFLHFLLLIIIVLVESRPIVRHIRSTQEFDRVLEKHASTGLPVIVDFYSDGCGPCRQMAPIFRKVAKETENKAVFIKVDTNQMHELSSRYQVRSLPTFKMFYMGKEVNQFSGASEQQLRQITDALIDRSKRENVKLTIESLTSYYQKHDSSKSSEGIQELISKCADMTPLKQNKLKECVGAAASQLARKLKKKYAEAPSLDKRFTEEEQTTPPQSESSSKSSSGSKDAPNLQFATKEELEEEIARRLEAEMDEREDEDDDDDFENSYVPGEWPERVTIIGGGPAGISAAIYAARAGLEPVIVAPPMGGQLQGKGVEVENYPGMSNVTGPAVVAMMRQQAASFGAKFETETVLSIDVTKRPFRVITNSSVIETHSIIVATGAESNWLGVKGEYEMRGGGVSSCATCDGAAFRDMDILVVGGGDTAMEDALVLARTSKSVTIIHRRDTFRASKILAQRVIEHPKINIKWNTVLSEILGELTETSSETTNANSQSDEEEIDLDEPSTASKIVTGAMLQNVVTGETSSVSCAAVFVAIGHTPTTKFLEGLVEFDPEKPGYIKTVHETTRTSLEGVFAAGDVADSVYRQAITSAGSGAAASLDAERWLSEEGLGNEAAEFEAELLAELMADQSNAASNNSAEDETLYNIYDDLTTVSHVKGVKESVMAREL